MIFILNMWALRNLQRHCWKSASLLGKRCYSHGNICLKTWPNNVHSVLPREVYCNSINQLGSTSGHRFMSTTRGRSMQSKVEKRMRRETGKTLKEIRRAKKIRKKLMTEEERLLYNLRRAKKKVALLLQKLKKYELPELPPPRHDPELLTLEQLQAYKKIGFRNRNYVPVGVRGVFGGVVQNMHLHWKFHETVQVCCDNFPREKIKEMATMIARLSGGIVVNIHDVKTIIMFRGRNYRQPKNLIPINTLTKRKALFKARFEQALESQKLNIKKIEQELRRKGVNPEDPIAMASIQRIATTFFRAIDEKQGTPYIFHGDKPSTAEIVDNLDESIDVPSEDSDQEELDRFIREIEDAADKEWEEEEAVEKEELSRIRYWGKDDMGRSSRAPNWRSDNSEDEDRAHVRRWNGTSTGLGNTERKNWDSDNDMSTASEDEWDYDDKVSDATIDVDRHNSYSKNGTRERETNKIKQRKSRAAPKEHLRDRASVETRWREHEDISLDGDVLGDSEDAVGESEDEDGHNFVESTMGPYDYLSNEDSEDNDSGSRQKIGALDEKKGDESWDSD